jgi:hypothetical protein
MPTAWSAQYQLTVALSTTEAEYIRKTFHLLWLSLAVSELLWEDSARFKNIQNSYLE